MSDVNQMNKEIIVHAEIEYRHKNGHWIHSDICPKMCEWENLDEKHRQYLHDCLDEWLDNSNGSGHFYIENEGFRARMEEMLDNI